MGYYVSNMIGIRLGGVFSGDADMDDLATRVLKLATEHEADVFPRDDGSLPHCLSRELVARKGGMAVIAGVFNHWTFDRVEPFAAALSKEFGTEVLLMSFDEEQETTQCQVYLDGKPIHDVSESPIGRVMRRVT